MKDSSMSKQYKYYLKRNIQLDNLKHIDSYTNCKYYCKTCNNRRSSDNSYSNMQHKSFNSLQIKKFKNNQSNRCHCINNKKESSLSIVESRNLCKKYNYLGIFGKKIALIHSTLKQFNLGRFKGNILHIMSMVFGKMCRKLQRCN